MFNTEQKNKNNIGKSNPRQTSQGFGDKKAEIRATMTWLVATIIILFVVIF